MFVHLHVHTHYSLLDATSRIEDLVEACKKHEMPAIALTDHGNLFGAIEFYEAARAARIKPIIGCEVYVAPGDRREKERGADGDNFYHLVLLAADITGWKNLVKLVSTSYIDGFYYKPRIDRQVLAKHAKGLIGLSACLKSELNRLFLQGREDEAERAAMEMADILGRENYYLEVQDHGIAQQKACNEWLFEFGKRSKIPVVATNDVHYLDRGDHLVHDVLLCIGTGKMLSDEKRKKYSSNEFYFKSPAEMLALFPGRPDVIERTAEIAQRCNLVLPLGEPHFPKFDSGDPRGNAVRLRDLCTEGMKKRYGSRAGSEEIRSRLDHELGVIEKQGFVDYFLITWDFIRFARDHGIPVGPGRGSAAGSIVSYGLEITDIDPLKYDLLFERFLNPGRFEPPDIDIDFCKIRREEVITYVREKYGHENVCQIITFGTMGARSAIRDIGRVLEVPLPDVDALAKKIPENTSLAATLETEPEVKARYDNEPLVRKIMDIGLKLEGLCRHASTHAAGVVISDKKLEEYVPLYCSKGEVTTQFDMNNLVKTGLLKMDFLGLINLTIIDKTLRNIEKTAGKKPNMREIPFDDKETYDLIGRGEVNGIFQLETSGGMRDLLQKMKPDRFEDLIATIAIYRPGPLRSGMVDSFIEVKHGRQKAHYLHPELESILKETHGMILYQEQAMRIANKLAGFSLTDADHLRKAMAKKKVDIMAEYRVKFVEGCAAAGKKRDVADKIYEQINHFAGYGFNKSHSAAYAILSYQTAWLKAHHPTEFMAALLTCRAGVADKFLKVVEDCRRMGIDVLPPDVNVSLADFTVDGGAIRFGLGAVKGIGEKAIQAIVDARAKGPFTSLFEFCRRVDIQAVNRKATEVLALAGAFDSLHGSRAAVIAGIDRAYESAQQIHNDKAVGQLTFFDVFQESKTLQEESLPTVAEWTDLEKLAKEKDTLGFYLSSHPLARHERELSSYSTHTARDLSEAEAAGDVVVGGMITGLSVRRVKSGRNAGRQFAKFNIEDLTGTLEAVAFSEAFDRHKNLIAEERIVFVKGKRDTRGSQASILVEEVIPVESAWERLAERVILSIGAANDQTLESIKKVLVANKGGSPVFIEYSDFAGRRILMKAGDEFRVKLTPSLDAAMRALLGQGRVHYAGAKPGSSRNGG